MEERRGMTLLLSFIATLLTIFMVPIVVYGLFAKYANLPEPEKKLLFFIGVLVQKIGTAFGFVALYYLAKDSLGHDWLVYGLVWAVMFAIVEVGQSFGPNHSKKEAIAGIISEFIYFPLAAFAVAELLS